MHDQHRARIRVLNDLLRQHHTGGRIFLSHGVTALGRSGISWALREIAAYDNFRPENDPYNEHDFGSVEVAGRRLFWKIEYYDRTMTAGAENPADPNTCTRVMTVMLAEEY